MKSNWKPLRAAQTFLCLSLLLATALGSRAAENTNATTRALSLQEAVRLALEHNLGIQIERFAPQIAQFNR